MHVLPQETKRPQIKKGYYNGLFLTYIYILFLDCHFYPSSTSSNHITSNNFFHGIINQASNPMAILCGESTSDHKTWMSILVNSLNDAMHCIHCSYHLLHFL